MTLTVSSLPHGPMSQNPEPVSVQNVFEHIANGAFSSSTLQNPSHLADSVLNGLGGFLQRSIDGGDALRNMKGNIATAESAGSGFKVASLSADSPKPSVRASDLNNVDGKRDVDRMVDFLIKSFDLSIETRVVANTSHGMTGSLNTLLKGQ